MKLPDETELVLVPRVATEEMLTAFYHTTYPMTDREWDCDIDAMGRAVHASMIAVAAQTQVDDICQQIAETLRTVYGEQFHWKTYLVEARAIVKRLMGE